MDTRKELVRTLLQIDEQIANVNGHLDQQQAVYGNRPFLDTNGKPLLADLLTARASILVALSALPEEESAVNRNDEPGQWPPAMEVKSE